MKTKSAYCKTCKQKTVHQEFEDRAISGGRIAAGMLLTGVPIFGVRKGKNWHCGGCGGVLG
jgi:hypothetical protein